MLVVQMRYFILGRCTESLILAYDVTSAPRYKILKEKTLTIMSITIGLFIKNIPISVMHIMPVLLDVIIAGTDQRLKKH